MISHSMEAAAEEEEQVKTTHSDFSIEHILNRAGNSSFSSNNCDDRTPTTYLDPYSWLQCTRYCPPKVPRLQKKQGPQKRQLGRHPRIPFTSHQLSLLEKKFHESPYLSSEEVINLSKELQLADIRVKIWFQNRRARERREKSSTVVQTNQDSQDQIHRLTPPASTSATPSTVYYGVDSNHFLLTNETPAIDVEFR